MGVEAKMKKFKTYYQTTDVQRTWRLHGWVPPSEIPEVQAKWRIMLKLNTEADAIESARQLKNLLAQKTAK